jgi:GNAT superfamily N-acetyltransferase
MQANVGVMVAPTHRHRGVGTSLLQRLVSEATERRLGWLVFNYPERCVDITRFLESSGLTVARRIGNGMVRAAIWVPTKAEAA